ncbi:uncharacterized protein LOC124169539 [Ischnura elegans]|uniref:uncharacterized protein LOC124169539 n=1 Tax=Ischnura elegans TaxID=197161 RepID=UPI001ED86865|nr:uncharacterized protein LOC124169539 [Ischnura elegans]
MEEDNCEVIPSKWIVTDGPLPPASSRAQVLWPPAATKFSVSKAIVRLADPLPTWDKHDICVMRYYDDYSKAHLVAKQAEETSNLDTDLDMRKRKRKPNRRFLSDRDVSPSKGWKRISVCHNMDDSDDSDEVRNTSRPKHKIPSPPPIHPSITGQTTFSDCPTSSPHRLTSSDSLILSEDEKTTEEKRPKRESIDNYRSEMNVLSKLVAELSSKLDVIIMNHEMLMTELMPGKKRLLRPNGLPSLPLKSVSAIMEFERFLGSEESMISFVSI